MPDRSVSSPLLRHPLLHPILFGRRKWKQPRAHWQWQLQRRRRRHTVYQTGNAMPRLQYRLPVVRYPDGLLIFCAVSLLMKAVLTCSQTTSNVVIPPVILNGPPPHVIYNPHDKASLPCTAYGTSPLIYEWFKNDEKLEPNSNTVIMDGSLILNDPVEGYYQCRVQNTAGVAISNVTYLQTAVINVTTIGRSVVQSIVRKGYQSLVLPCSHVLQSIPSATITWFSDDDNPVPDNDRVTIAENGSLVFTYLLQSDSNHNSSAFYRCRAYNPVTKREVGGSYYHLTVSGMTVERLEDEPELLYSSASVVYALEGQPFQISCLFGGVPTPAVEWLLPNGDTDNKRQFYTRQTKLSDQGNYTCRGKTIRHTKEEHFQVIVDALPRVEVEPKEQVAQRGSTVRFQCQAVGRPKPAVSWFVNGTRHNESFADDSLVLFDVQDGASISCNVSNKHGYQMRSTYLLVVEDVIATTSSQERIDDISKPSAKTTTTVTITTTNEESERSSLSGSKRRPSISVYGPSRSSTPSNTNNSETGRHIISDAGNAREKLWFLIALPLACLVAGLIAVAYCQHRRRRSYSLDDRESQIGLQKPIETNFDSDDSGYDDVSRKPKQLKQAKRLSDTPEVEESHL